MSYPCTRCGLCCKNIGQIKALSAYSLDNGVCKNFDENDGCKIYPSRPLVCRIDEGYEKLFSDKISRSIYYQKNAEVCNDLQIKARLNDTFRVELSHEFKN